MNPTRRSFLRHAALTLGGFALWPTSLLAATAEPGEKIHVVQRGDTISSLAERHGVNAASLLKRNQLDGPRILVGQRLIIPAPLPAPVAPASPISPAPASVLEPVITLTRSLKITPARWTHLVVHHSGVEAGNALSYDGAHRRRGMENGLAYHFVIGNGRDSGDGLIEIGPRWPKQLYGGHVRSQAMNDHGIGICLVGNFETRVPGKKQLASLYALLDWLRGDGLPGGAQPRVTVHRWVDPDHTVCPGRRFPFAELKSRYGPPA